MPSLTSSHVRRDDRQSALEQNKALACRWLDLVSAGDIDGLAALITPDWLMLGGPPDLPRGRAGLELLFATFGEISQTWRVDLVLAENDLVAVRATNYCTMGSFFGVPGRGIEQVFTATFVFEIRDGRIARTFRNADDLGRLLQLGARIEAGAA